MDSARTSSVARTPSPEMLRQIGYSRAIAACMVLPSTSSPAPSARRSSTCCATVTRSGPPPEQVVQSAFRPQPVHPVQPDIPLPLEVLGGQADAVHVRGQLLDAVRHGPLRPEGGQLPGDLREVDPVVALVRARTL